MPVPAFYVHAGFGLLLSGLAVPLVLRRIPMNAGYGIRIPESFKSDACWYDINAFGGRLLLGYGLLLTAFAFVTRDMAPPDASLLSPVFNIGPLLVCLALLPVIRSYARKRVQKEP